MKSLLHYVGWVAFLGGVAFAQTPPRPAASAPGAPAAALPAPAPAPVSTPAAPTGTTDDVQVAGDLTVVTSDQLTYDGSKGYALFERNVVVSDPHLKLKADKLTITFEGRSTVKSILAEGHVVISQEDRRGWGQRASYDVATGKIVLEGDPRVMRGKDMLIGDRITFWRDENRVLVESDKDRSPSVQQPGARLIIYPEKGRSPLNPTGGARGKR